MAEPEGGAGRTVEVAAAGAVAPVAGHAGSRDRRASILSAALACFNETGIEATTIEAIRERAGCSIGSLYHHFKSKEGLASRLFVDGIADLNAGLIVRLEACDGPEAGVRACVEHYAEWVDANTELARFLLHSGTSTSRRTPARNSSACTTCTSARCSPGSGPSCCVAP